ncbi:MAG: hypothetical protein EXR93_06925 [Gemmatimonadetes bacterium]|nr:hypothetical protein [Gemmatimonadota bacterium]
MFKSVKHFLSLWNRESENTARVLACLTDESLHQPTAPGCRNLGELAWHIAGSMRSIAGKTGLEFDGVNDKMAVPSRAADILAGYRKSAEGLAAAIRSGWTDETLNVKDKLYGYEWPRGFTLEILVSHEIHHRGQATVLMRQAGLKVPGVYGPSKDD